MLFNSFNFVYFFAIVCFITLLINRTRVLWGRNICLLLASYYFYGSFNILFLIILLYITLITYLGGLCFDKTNHKKALTGWVVFLSLVPLATFKYSAFILYDILNLPIGFGRVWIDKLILPVGISFFTFPLFMFTYLPVMAGSIFSKPEWKPIKHHAVDENNRIIRQKKSGRKF